MNWVRDRTRRFQWRPYFDQQEIDVQCEDIVARFMYGRGGSLSYPISTDDLTVMIEQDVSDLDLYANLSSEGRGIEGVSEFHRRIKPSVRIAKYLSQEPSRQNRLRSTLAYEYGHVVFHSFLWKLDGAGPRTNARRRPPPRCRRARILVAPQSDWMEWQAGYASGALLMPITRLKGLVAASLHEWGLVRHVEADSDRHKVLIGRIAEAFAVSKDAAKTRLHKLGYVGPVAKPAA
jgi:hypothetical protein